jgi:hypothetical protein
MIIIDKPINVVASMKEFKGTLYENEPFEITVAPLKTSENLNAYDKSEKSDEKTFEFSFAVFNKKVTEWKGVFVEKDTAKEHSLKHSDISGDEMDVELICNEDNKKFLFEYANDFVNLVGKAADEAQKDYKKKVARTKKK